MAAPLNIPDEFLCPIGFTLMEDPVILEDGHTYDRHAITEWLRRSYRSPLSNTRVTPGGMKPNFALRAAIERWKADGAAGAAAGAGAGAAAAAAAPPPTPLEFKVRAVKGGVMLSAHAVGDAAPMNTAILAVLDRSGSMGEPSAKPGGGAVAEAALFSRMDVLKQSAVTVANLLAGRAAAFGVISFSDSATVDLPLRKMDMAGLAEAERQIRALYPAGGTNIWAGLRLALDTAAAYAAANPTTNIHIALLTDGEPTPDYAPLQGIVGALERKLATLKTQVTLSSFGFGYRLDAKLLEEICTRGGGSYGYIPDCSLAGSVFINYCAAALSTVAAHVRVGGATATAVTSGLARFVPLPAGRVAVGQQVEILYGPGEGKAVATVVEGTHEEDDNAAVIVRLVTELEKMARQRYEEADWSGLAAMVDWMGDLDGGFRTAVVQDIKHDAPDKGQLLKAVEKKEWFESWGINHLISYKRALACAVCPNFKDAALQYFAGPLFRTIQAAGNDIFDNLPAPKPSLSSASSYGWQTVAAGGGGGLAIPTTMSLFNNAQGGCFAGHCLVEMAGEGGAAPPQRKYVSQLRAGDVVRGGHRIACVVRTPLTRRPKMVNLPGLCITAWHPIRTETAWKFPCELAEPTETAIQAYYNLVLESGHVVRIANYDVCTLGHGFTDNIVIRHPYFGTQAVIDDLRRLPGWDTGLVQLEETNTQRSAETGLITSVV